MNDQLELTALRARIAELESENQQLRQTQQSDRAPGTTARRRPRGLSILSAILIVVSVIVAPVAVLGTWARAQLVDTDRFAATFAPLAQEAAVQDLLTDQVMVAIDENLDIDGLVAGVFDGLGQLELPNVAQSTLPLLQGPAAEGLRSLIRNGVHQVVVSPQFAQLWETVLRQSHSQAIAVLQDDPDAALMLADDGTLSLRLKPLITEVRQVLIDQGFSFAENIPAIDRSIPLFQAEELTTVRTAYQAAVSTGYVLPWVLVVFLVVGVALARHRMRALAWAGFGFALSFLTLRTGIGIGKWYFMNSMNPAFLPPKTAGIIFDQVTVAISSVVVALIMLSIFILIGAWFAGESKLARNIRQALDTMFSAARRWLDAHGLHPRAVGEFVERWRRALQVATAILAGVILLMIRSVTASSVITTVVIVLLVLIVIELVRRDHPWHGHIDDSELEGTDPQSESTESANDGDESSETADPVGQHPEPVDR